MSEEGQSAKDDGKKRKLDEMNSGEGVEEKSSEDALKDKKMKTEDPIETTATTGSSNSSPPASPQHVSLNPGKIYRIQSVHLGDFHFRAGDMPFLYVNGAPVTISDCSGNVIFSGGTFRDRVEIKENVNRWFFRFKTISVTLLPGGNPRPQIQLKGNSISVYPGSSAATKFATEEGEVLSDPPLQLVANPKEAIVINGQRSALIIGSGGVLTFNGTGLVTVHGSLEGIRNNGSGTVKVKGSVKGEVLQSGSGSIHIDGDVHADIVNSGGGSIEVGGKHLGNGMVKNVPGEGKVSIANGGGGWFVHTWKLGWRSAKKLD